LRANEDDWDKLKNEKKSYKLTRKFHPVDDNFAGDEYNTEFYVLNPLLQKEMINFLTQLEIIADVNYFARYLGLNKERREYMKWMYKILNFINE